MRRPQPVTAEALQHVAADAKKLADTIKAQPQALDVLKTTAAGGYPTGGEGGGSGTSDRTAARALRPDPAAQAAARTLEHLQLLLALLPNVTTALQNAAPRDTPISCSTCQTGTIAHGGNVCSNPKCNTHIGAADCIYPGCNIRLVPGNKGKHKPYPEGLCARHDQQKRRGHFTVADLLDPDRIITTEGAA